MADFKMNLDGVSPAGVTSYVDPGEYRAKITSAVMDTETKYGNAGRFDFKITDESFNGARLDTLLWVPDETFQSKAAAVAKETGRKDVDQYVENFGSLMASKWVSIMQAAGLSTSGNVDTRKVVKALQGKEITIIVEDAKKRKPTDPDRSNINGFLPLADEIDAGDDSEDSDTADEIDLDEL